MKKFKVLFLFCVIAILMIPFSFTTLESDAIAWLDNRALRPMPVNLQDWILYGEDFLKDHIGFREDILLFYRNAIYRLFNVFDHPVYKPGKNGHLYMTSTLALEACQSLYEDADVEHIRNRLGVLHQYLQKKGIHFLFVHVPMKQNVYPEFVPAYYGKKERPMFGEALEQSLKNSGIPCLFTLDALLRQKAIAPTHNKKFDPAHFNAVGAFAVHEAIAHKMKEFYPDYPPLQRNDYRQTTETRDLKYFFLPHTQEEIPVLERIPRSFEIKNINDDLIHDLPNAKVTFNPQAALKKTLLLIGDSHMYDQHIYSTDRMVLDYYAHAFEKVYLIPFKHHQDTYAILERYKPDLLLYEATEYVLLDPRHFAWEDRG